MRSSAEHIAYCSVFVCAALALSYLEVLLPYVPIPGFRPGLANIAVMSAFFLLGMTDAAAVALCRVALSAVLFGSPISFLFSLCGGLFSIAALAVTKKLLRGGVGCIGIGVLCAASHCVGQCLVASLLYGASLLVTYLPWLLLLSLPTGALTGSLTYVTVKSLSRYRR